VPNNVFELKIRLAKRRAGKSFGARYRHAVSRSASAVKDLTVKPRAQSLPQTGKAFSSGEDVFCHTPEACRHRETPANGALMCRFGFFSENST
jgi:hypothetical protein